MNLTNLTPFPAFLHREVIAGDRIAAAAIVRATFEMGSPCRAARDQVWRVSPNAWEGPQGMMETDASFDRDGCDVLVFGRAATDDGSPATSVDVAVTVGDFSASLRVFGDRKWVRAADGLVASEPVAFRAMPLGLERAYGGIALFDELPIPHADNPRGKGYFLEEEEAEGGALPNLEDPDRPIARWDDRPDPVGCGVSPFPFGPRIRRAAVIRDGVVVGTRDAIHNVAFPAFVCPDVAPGAQVVVRGVGPEQRFSLPAVPIFATTRVGATEHHDPARIDQIGIEAELGRFFVTYRYTFVYPLRHGEVRACRLSWAPPPELLPQRALPQAPEAG